jgi:hypothetical protein
VTDETPNPTAPEPEPGSPAPDPATSRPGRAVSSAETRPRRPDYRGEELDPERGPGLGCFWFQVIVLGFFIVLIPIGLELNWPFELLAFLLFIVIGLLLLTGQSVIFLLRLVAADRRAQGRRRPLASPTKTVGELEDEQHVGPAADPTAAGAEPGVATVAGTDEPDESNRAHDSEAMIRDRGDVVRPPAGADVPESAASSDPDPDGARSDAADRAPADTRSGGTGPAEGAASADDTQPAEPMHESSPDRQGAGMTGTGDADEPVAGVDAGEDADAPPADADVDGDAPDPAAPPDAAPPEEPDPGVRQ